MSDRTDSNAETPHEQEAIERAISLIAGHDFAAALSLMDATVTQNPSCARAACARGSALKGLTRYAEALACYDRAISLNPRYARAYFLRGMTHFDLGDPQNGFRDVDAAMQLGPEPIFHFCRGQQFAAAQLHKAAIADFSVCIEQGYSLGSSLVYRGACQVLMGAADAAIADFRRAIALDDHNCDAHVRLSHLFIERGDWNQALSYLNSGLAANPHDVNLCAQRGYVLYQLKDWEQALNDINSLIAVGHDLARSYCWRGLIWENLLDEGAAVADQNEAIARDPRQFAAYLARARVRFQLGKLDEAHDDATVALKLDPNDADAWVLRAKILMALGNNQLALDDLAAAMQRNPEHQEGLETRIQLQAGLGNFSVAEKDLDTLDRANETKTVERTMNQRQVRTTLLLAEHFTPQPVSELAIAERVFPYRVRADLQRAIDELSQQSYIAVHFSGIKATYYSDETSMADLMIPNAQRTVLSVPAQYEEVDIGESDPVRCLKNGIWLLERSGLRVAMLLVPHREHGRTVGMRLEVATPHGVDGQRMVQEIFHNFEEAVRRSQSYRGKVLSLETETFYSGKSAGIRVHRLPTIKREHVILPSATLELLDRNVIQFAQRRHRLAQYGLPTKKGLLFYGPPGTGKSHTIQYLAGILSEHTTLLITAEQVGLLHEYMTVARLLQPSIVVIEDADLIARSREQMDSTCEEVLLNRLLNEMDGLRPDAEVFFILTTNRPEALEGALASRPGRIDQAIEFPLPDDTNRRLLIQLYGQGMQLSHEVVDLAVRRTERASASFIKELMRRAAQFQLERDDSGYLSLADIECALQELLFAGGSLNGRLLGLMPNA